MPMVGTIRHLTRHSIRRHCALMKNGSVEPYNVRFCARVKAIREEMGWSQKQMSLALGLELETYKKYEQRSPLPHRFIERFCLISGVASPDLFNVELPLSRLPIRRGSRSGDRAKPN